MAGSRKTSLMEGIGGIASNTSALGAMVAGCQVTANLNSTSEEEDEFHWDDDEEQRYRDWLKDVASQRQNEAEWQEYEGEEAYRARLRAADQSRAEDSSPINWDDSKERDFRRKYIEMRRRQNAEADWNEYKAEEDHREEMRRKQESRKKSKLVWDDEEERKCQQRYRKKYK